jgi:hypothetical protein
MNESSINIKEYYESKYMNDPKFRRLSDVFFSFIIENQFTIDAVEQALNLAWNKYKAYIMNHGIKLKGEEK